MKHLIFFLMTFLISISTINTIEAQNQNIQNAMRDQIFDLRTNNKNSRNLKIIKGSPFINEKFSPVNLKRFENKIFSARYDANLSEMQILFDNDTIVLNNSEDFELTFISDKKVYKTYSFAGKDGIQKRRFLVVLRETDSSALLKEEVIKFYEKQAPASNYDKAKPAEFKRGTDIYYFKTSDRIALLPKKRKEFLLLFPKHSDKIKEFIKKQKISLENDQDLINLFDFMKIL